MLNSRDYLAIRQEAWENDGGTGYVWLPNYTTANDDAATREAAYKEALQRNTNWVDETVGQGFKQMYNFGVRKGSKKYGMYAGVTYDDNGSFLLGNNFERISGRLNFDYNVTNELKLMFSGSLSRGTNNRVDVAWSGGLGNAMSTALPFYPVTWDQDVFDEDGELQHAEGDYFIWSGGQNPVAYQNLRRWRNTEDRSINNLTLLYTPIENLTIKASGGFDYMHLREDIFNPAALTLSSDLGNASRFANYILNWNYSATANYLWDYGENHSFNFMVGSEFQRSDSYGYGIDYFGVEGPVFDVDSLRDDAANVNRTANNPSQWSFLSYFARVNYILKDKYTFQGTARVDGSSRFGRNNRYGFFPSLSAGWIISEERFMKQVEQISFMKIRASYGLTGNAAIPDYARFGTFSNLDNGILYNGQPIIFPLQLANPDLRWETSATWDAALEVGLFNDRITFELGVYRKYSRDVLLNVNVPPSTGFTNYWDNVAEILNRGIEFQIRSRNIIGPRFNWTTDFNIARNYNELVDIGPYTPDAVSGGTNDSRVIVGKPVGSFFLVEFSHVDPENGLPVYIDLDGNETYDYDNAIRKYVGDGLPRFVGGLTNNFSFGNWDLMSLFTFSLGAKIFDSSAKRQLGVVTDWNMRDEVFDRWRQPGDLATFPRMTLDETTYGLPSGFPWWNTSLFVYDASFLRLRNLALGYNIPNVRIGKRDVYGFRIAVNVTNLFTLTDFPGLDPEVVRDFEDPQDRNLSPNVTYLTPPQERSYNISINLNF
jgi:TonB-linked SusC/RagA family outer membrane protein